MNTAPSRTVAIFSKFAAGSIAAAVLAGFVLIYQLYDNSVSPAAESQVNIALYDELVSGFENSSVLGLSEQQSGSLAMIMEDYFDSITPRHESDLDRIKTDILSAAISSPDIGLDGLQARAMAGLMGKWEPRIEDGRIVDYVWMDDAELEQYLAGCSAYCHQGTRPEVLEEYLTNCLMSRHSGSCSPVQISDRMRDFDQRL